MSDYNYSPQEPNALLQTLKPQLEMLEHINKIADISSTSKVAAGNILESISPLVQELQSCIVTRFNMLDFDERRNLQINHESSLKSTADNIEHVYSHSELETVCAASEHTILKFLNDLGGNAKTAAEKLFQYFGTQPSPSETRFLAYSSLILSIISLFK